MSRQPVDLSALFAAAGAQERAAAAPLDLAALRARAHRRRAARVAGTSVLSVAGVAALAAGFALGPWRDAGPVPPVDGTTSSPTPTPTPSPTWPSAVTLDGAVPGCGEPTPALVAPDGEPELAVEDVTQSEALRAGGEAQVGIALDAPDGFPLDAREPRVLLVRDGVVLATADRPASPDGEVLVPGGGALTLPSQIISLNRCDVTEPPVPLTGGAYDLYVLVDLVLTGATPDRITIVGGPYAVTLDGFDDPHPPVSDLTITSAGLGPLLVGVPVAVNPGAAMIAFHEDHCPDGGAWLPDGYDRVPALFGDATVDPFRFVVVDDVVRQVAVLGPQLRTAEGIGIGSSRASLRATYPDLVLESASSMSEVWRLRGPTCDLLFETGDPRYTDTTGDDVVVNITITVPGQGPATSWGSGMMPGTCGAT